MYFLKNVKIADNFCYLLLNVLSSLFSCLLPKFVCQTFARQIKSNTNLTCNFVHSLMFSLARIIKQFVKPAFRSGVIAFLLLSIPNFVFAYDELETDHPLMSRFEGAQYFFHYNFDYIAVDIPVKVVEDINNIQNKLTVAGKGSFIKYQPPSSASRHEVIKTFKAQFKAPMFNVIFECEKNDDVNTCGKEIYNFSQKYQLEFGFQDSCTTDDELYLATAKIVRNDGKNTYVFVCVHDNEVNQTIIEEKDFNPNKIKVLSSYQPTAQSLSGLKAQAEQDAEGGQDHPLISRFPNSYIDNYKKIDMAEAKFPVKSFTYHEKDNLTDDYFVKTRGAINFIQYQGQKGLSRYQVYENYLAALNTSDMEILFKCNGSEECGSGLENNSSIGDIAPEMKGVRDSCAGTELAIIAAKKVMTAQQNIYAFICIHSVGSVGISQTIIEEKPLTTGLISLSADEMASAITTKGKVAIYGIHFATNSDEIMQSSLPVFDQLSTLLTKNKQLKLYVVGHTDSQGDEAYNQTLAEKRAKAVVNKLVQTYEVAPARLQARGVGELVPISTNQASEGRQLNRRVELVQM